MIPIAREVERRLQGCTKPITVAVMGCVVNGPGEARAADVGIAGGDGEGLLFPPWRNSVQGAPGQAGGRPDGRDRQAVREGPCRCDKNTVFHLFRELCAAPDLGLLPTTPVWWAAAWTGRSAPWSWSSPPPPPAGGCRHRPAPAADGPVSAAPAADPLYLHCLNKRKYHLFNFVSYQTIQHLAGLCQYRFLKLIEPFIFL